MGIIPFLLFPGKTRQKCRLKKTAANARTPHHRKSEMDDRPQAGKPAN
jgi:hypothetical protein